MSGLASDNDEGPLPFAAAFEAGLVDFDVEGLEGGGEADASISIGSDFFCSHQVYEC